MTDGICAGLLAAVLLAAIPALPAGAQTESPTATSTRTPSPTISATPTATASLTPTPLFLIADANCDERPTAADFVAAITVSTDPTRFPDCPDADTFRGVALSDRDLVPIEHDIFGTFNPPYTPTPTASPTITRTGTRTATPTATRRTTVTPTATASPSLTPSPSPTITPTPIPSNTPTVTFTRSATPTRTPSVTPTPTGMAYQFTGTWVAGWTGQICYLAGQPAFALVPTTYQVTAVGGQLDIQIVGGAYIARGVNVDSNGVAAFLYSVFSQNFCLVTGSPVPAQFAFEYVFDFNLNGTGTATADWTYGHNPNYFCAVCGPVHDTAQLHRTSGP